MWDVPTGTAVETLNHTKAVHAVGVAPGGGGPVAFGGAEGALRLWDSRAPRGEDLVSS
jgi:ribosome biogenesis protein